jgi:hypothetical protein
VTRRDAGRRDDDTVAPTKQLPTQTAAMQTSVSLQSYLSPSLDDQATGFCFTHFLNHVIFSTNVISQFGDQTADVWRWGVDDRLLTSFKTIGFAGLYYQTRHPGFERLARYHYLKAVHIVNETLSDHKQAISDSMLLSIIILSQFESMCGPAEDYLSAWETHMHGAVSLIIMRGRSQMSTAIGRRLFMSITTSLLTSCLQRRCPFPPSVEEIMKATSHELMAKSPPWRLTEIMIDIANLRASYQHGLRQNLVATIQMTLHLDSKLISIEGSLPSSWTFQVIEFSGETRFVPNGRYHVYPGYWQAQIWNSIRVCRLLLQELIREVLAGDPTMIFSTNSELWRNSILTQCIRTMHTIHSDVQDSVYQHLGHCSLGSSDRLESTETFLVDFPAIRVDAKKVVNHPSGLADSWSNFHVEIPDISTWSMLRTHLPLLRTPASSLLSWTLLVTGTSDVATRTTRTWARDILLHLGYTLNVREAKSLVTFFQDLE